MERFESVSPIETKKTFAEFNAAELLQPFSSKLSGDTKLQPLTDLPQISQSAQARVGESFDYAKSAGIPKLSDGSSFFKNLRDERPKISDSVLAIKPVQAGIGEDLALLGILGGAAAVMSGKATVEKVLTKTIMTGGGLMVRNPRATALLAAGAYVYNLFGSSDTKKR
ncbi:MAG: hypothetical protein C0473_02240 [Cyanobacteria bacterium DS3.002]|nr:hypothetical protein [Cyanobacteria bacterium DS3.002]MBA4049632.1 hypothetical protein [Cyanobacteria bacterium DS2.008]